MIDIKLINDNYLAEIKNFYLNLFKEFKESGIINYKAYILPAHYFTNYEQNNVDLSVVETFIDKNYKSLWILNLSEISEIKQNIDYNDSTNYRRLKAYKPMESADFLNFKIQIEKEFELDDNLLMLLNYLDNKTVIYRGRVCKSQNDVKIWYNIFEKILSKYGNIRSNKEKFILTKKINDFYSLNLLLDLNEVKLRIKFCHEFSSNFKFTITNDLSKVSFNVYFNSTNSSFNEHIIDNTTFCKKLNLFFKSYFYYVDEYINIMKPYFDNQPKAQ